MAVTVPPTVYAAVEPYAQQYKLPDAIWEGIAYYESNFNVSSIGDGPQFGGYSYGLFQLHVTTNILSGTQAQGNVAVNWIMSNYNVGEAQAITILRNNAGIQAKFAIPPIASAWTKYGPSFNPNDRNWWLNFLAASGHPGGGSYDPVTQQYTTNFINMIVTPDLFGIRTGSKAAGTTKQGTPSLFAPTYLKDMVAWLKDPSIPMWIRRDHKSAAEGGVDLTSPGGTPVYALGTGPIVGAGYFCHNPANFAMTSENSAACSQPGYGVVTQRINVPGYGVNDIYYQHIDIVPSIQPVFDGNAKQVLNAGDVVGTVRANIGEVEIGFNAQWGTIWGINHPGAWPDDPRPMIAALMAGGGISGVTDVGIGSLAAVNYTPLLDQVHQTLIATPGFYGIALALDEAEQFVGWVDLTGQGSSLTIPGVDTGIPGIGTVGGGSIALPDLVGFGRSVGATITDNFVPFTIRSGLVMLGSTICMLLIFKAISGPVMQLAPLFME